MELAEHEFEMRALRFARRGRSKALLRAWICLERAMGANMEPQGIKMEAKWSPKGFKMEPKWSP